MSETTVREALAREMDGTILRVAVTKRRGETVYAVVSEYQERSNGDRIAFQTVVVDFGEDRVSVTDNGLWVPADADLLGHVAELATNAKGHLTHGTTGTGISSSSAVDGVDGDLVLDRGIDAPGERPEQADDSTEWDGPPGEAWDLLDRLDEAGVETERFARLQDGRKTPVDRVLRPLSDTWGTYAVETVEDDPLVILDVDDPEAAPLDALPDTYAVSSPHGPDERAHHYVAVEDPDELRERFGTGAVKPEWGDAWLDGEYVVGPGSVLTACAKDSCSTCGTEGGRYEVVNDRPIATVSTERMTDLLGGADPSTGDDTDGEQPDEDTADGVLCAECGDRVPSAESTATLVDGEPATVCSGCHR